MLNAFARLLLVSTSFTPISLAIALRQFEGGGPWYAWGVPLSLFVALPAVCWILLTVVGKTAQKRPIRLHSYVQNDREMLTFLFVYLLPFIWADKLTFAGAMLTTAYVAFVLTLAIASAGAFHFNPVLRVLGFRFYTVNAHCATPKLLISKKKLRNAGIEVSAVALTDDTFLLVGD